MNYVMNIENSITVIARAAYEAIRAYQELTGQTPSPKWEEAGQLQASYRHGVEFALRNPTPGAQHEAWRAARITEGWTYGAVKDPVIKTHPCLVPYEDVPYADKAKDRIVIDITQALAKTFGLLP
jgi:hypothetical protein